MHQQTNSTRIDFQNPLLKTVMPLIKGGIIRIGGTYTDFVQYYVPGAESTHPICPYQNQTGNLTRKSCPGNSFPCCLPLSMDRWTEALKFVRHY
jgi:hypothetical protein